MVERYISESPALKTPRNRGDGAAARSTMHFGGLSHEILRERATIAHDTQSRDNTAKYSQKILQESSTKAKEGSGAPSRLILQITQQMTSAQSINQRSDVMDVFVVGSWQCVAI